MSDDLDVLHVGSKSEQTRQLAAAMNRRLTTRGLADKQVKVFDGEMTLTPELHKATITTAWALGATAQTLEEMRAKQTVPVGVARMIRFPGRRSDDQMALGKKRVADMRKKRKARANAKGSRQKALAAFASFIGTTESPPGSNGNPRNISLWEAEFGFGRVAWCGISAGHFLRKGGVQGVTSRIAAVAFIEDDARAGRAPFRSWTTSRDSVLPGDLVVIGGRGVHVEMVEKLLPGGAIQTIGGNTSPGNSGSQANGGGVWRRHRDPAAIHGIARVNFP